MEAVLPSPPPPSEQCLARVEWQSAIFAPRPRRLDLLRLSPSWPLRPLRVRVFRNQPFEFVSSAASRFGAYAGLDLKWSLGEYDDSLTDVDISQADAAVVWYDYDRIERPAQAVFEWLGGRLAAMRRSGEAPVIVHTPAFPPAGVSGDEAYPGLAQAVSHVPGVHLFDQSAIQADLGDQYVDRRPRAISGSSLSDAAYLVTARQLALRWLPAAAGDFVKAVVVDLDGTLYSGVLGEEGPAGVKIDPGHEALARTLTRLRERGIFLGLLSRNDPQDVDALFQLRTDLLLRPEHFSAKSVSWGHKSAGLAAIADRLRVGADSMLVLDDNPGELAEIAAQSPGLRCLWADPSDPASTDRALNLYPGLHRLASTTEAPMRVADLAAANDRSRALLSAEDPDAYLRSLHITLSLCMNPTDRLTRLSELTQKTNQFNTTLTRMTEAEIERYMRRPEVRVVAGSLRDRLSDSGMICIAIVRLDDQHLVVDELAISCRALGRGIETTLVLAMLLGVFRELPATSVVFSFTPGPRNEPARDWLEGLTHTDPTSTGAAVMAWSQTEFESQVSRAPVSITWEQ